MRDKTFFFVNSAYNFLWYMNVFHHARLQIKKMDKVDSKNINGCLVCGLHIKKKTNNFIFA